MKGYLILLITIIVCCNCHGDYWELGRDYIYVNHAIAKQMGDGKYRPLKIIVMDNVINFNYREEFGCFA